MWYVVRHGREIYLSFFPDRTRDEEELAVCTSVEAAYAAKRLLEMP